MAVDISSYLFRKVLRVDAFDPGTKELLGTVTRFTNVSFQNGQEETQLLDGGTPFATIDYGKTASFTFTTQLVNDAMMALQSGTTPEMIENTSEILISDSFVVNNGVGVAKWGGTGAAGSEIRYAYLLDSGGSPVKTFTQAATAGPGVFSYASATKELTFDPSDVPDGREVLIHTYPLITVAKKIENNSDTFSKAAECRALIMVSDSCDPNKVYLMQVVFENGKFSGTYEWSNKYHHAVAA